ncbi:MAG: ATP-NAD kinase [Firmicutes bacterium HGW-Firmicutes-11]|jgi:predicted polyphosphate/ATP-dependent NAD kinase|nr:MAG: ATP-NAD kinase [Firmicutes bacterium HGW-Firmicutes-11]
MRKIGFIVNPIAGMGGRVGLKGTDGVLEEALIRGAVPSAPDKAMRGLRKLLSQKNNWQILTGEGELGERISRELEFKTNVVYRPAGTKTSGADTVGLAKALVLEHVDLILFAGGDGTARDLVAAHIGETPVVGIPAGVKVHSPVFATHPETAGELALRYLMGNKRRKREAEVLDISEKDYRAGNVVTELFGYLSVPDGAGLLQNRKAPSPASEASAQREIAMELIASMEAGVAYLLGPGTTTREVSLSLYQPFTLLGVDVILDKKAILIDATEQQLIGVCREHPCRLVVTPTGGQGFLLGRGNQQISPAVLEMIGPENMIVVATTGKLAELQHRPLMIDTGDLKTDDAFKGYTRIITGFSASVVYPVRSGSASYISNS